MLSTLDVPFADVDAAGLGWELGLPARSALAVATARFPGDIGVELRLLGASHQVIVEYGGRRLCSETVACDLPAARELPASFSDAGYVLRSTSTTLAPADFEAAVEAVVDDLHERPNTLVGAFPGDRHAVTALVVEQPRPGEINWRTWHAYPRGGDLVHTQTRLTLAERDR